ncbi:uncharacterized protein LOC132284774 [Cornus florida]|uniref:uncharacterized protein LOC132284774 n=1 Tax=Cornus florida TaxID=4283 RepID=UPI00289DF099|nr:uncharacterized protein LOC132284774 [Cornus florida]
MVVSATATINNKRHAVVPASKSDMKNKNNTHDCESSITTTNRREENSESADFQQPLQNENISLLKNGKSESLVELDQNGIGLHDHGESTFSAFGLLSSPKANSGQIAYSGSISHRSNSSTTSTRSFAFPVLPSEWNDSPVRMMEADRRQLRKRWKFGFLCCKF